MSLSAIAGKWDPAFEPVARCFADLVARGEERGALAVLGPRGPLLDVWGGSVHPGSSEAWGSDTLACCFSVSKGVCSIAAHVLIERGQLDLHWPVARLWPEFAEGGKHEITVLDLLTHRAGLPAVTGTVHAGDLYDWDRMTGLLAASEPVVTPRSDPVYHNMTYGYLLGEVLRRASGLPSLRAVIDDTLCLPLGADFRIGLDLAEELRCATMEQDDPASLLASSAVEASTLFARSMAFFGEDEDFNTRRWRGAQIGSGSGHATAKGLARIFSQLVLADALITPERQREIRREQATSNGLDPVMDIPIRYGQGVELSTPPMLDFGPNAATPGHWGAGGATAFADPDTGLSFGYVTGRMARGLGSSRRASALIKAFYDCV